MKSWIVTIQIMYQHAYSPHCCPYISYSTSWENLHKHQDIFCLVIICFTLVTCVFDQVGKLWGENRCLSLWLWKKSYSVTIVLKESPLCNGEAAGMSLWPYSFISRSLVLLAESAKSNPLVTQVGGWCVGLTTLSCKKHYTLLVGLCSCPLY